ITDVQTVDLRKVIDAGKFRASYDFGLLRESDVILICVPTPLKRKNHPDISYIKGAVKEIAGNLKNKALVVLESTTYPGTTKEVILPLLEAGNHKHGDDFFLCFSPERIDPGNAQYTVDKIPKVVGGINPTATLLGKLSYSVIIKKVVPVSSCRVAETVKLLENTFRLINIGLIDEIAMMAHQMGIDIWEVVEAASTKPFGFMPFYPGPGVGGHCIPKDPLYLYWKAKKFGFKSRFIKLASDIISHMPAYVVERVKAILANKGIALKESKVLVVGVTYKKDIKDLRQSPPLDIISALEKEGAQVNYFDPLIPYLKFKEIDQKSINIKSDDIAKYDVVIIATDHSGLDYKLIRRRSRLIFDSRNVYKGVKDDKIYRL
ncbi:MAG: nucleotide sugar dehydrogenase, partial [Candidatus Omnitrophica bacterium]|nr:nucleotide sugar dehydrogenase [Candidatus Omnitrophota bacterium]